MSAIQSVQEKVSPADLSNPYIVIAAAVFAIFAVSSVFLGLHYAHSNALILKDIEELPTTTLLAADIPVITVFGVLGMERCVIAVRYEDWRRKSQSPVKETEDFKKNHLSVTAPDPFATAPRGVFELAYQQLQVIAGNLVSPARWLPISEEEFAKDKEKLEEERYTVEEVTLTRDGTDYKGFLVTKPGVQKYAIQAVGITGSAQAWLLDMGRAYGEIGFNVLIVNPPGVGGSQGKTTGETLGQAQEMGLRYLEHLKPEQIILSGFSLGGGMIGQAILQHEFKQGPKYLAMFQMTFSRLSDAAFDLIDTGTKHLSSIVSVKAPLAYCGTWGAYLGVRLLGMEMDSVQAVKRLVEKQIPIVVVQKSTSKEAGVADFKTVKFSSDGIISERASLGAAVQKELPLASILVYNPTTPADLPHNTGAKAFVTDAFNSLRLCVYNPRTPEELPHNTKAQAFVTDAFSPFVNS